MRSDVDYVYGDYYKPDVPIDVNMKLKTCDGFYLNTPNVYEIKTNNKFIFSIKHAQGLLLVHGIKTIQLF